MPFNDMNKELSTNAAIITDGLILIEPGIYTLAFLYYETVNLFGCCPKVVLRFRVIEPGLYFGMEFSRYYNATKLTGKPGRNGKFKIGFKSDLLREFLNIFPDYNPKRLDRIPMSYYEEIMIHGRISTCDKDYKQRKRHDLLRYSIVSELLRIKNT